MLIVAVPFAQTEAGTELKSPSGGRLTRMYVVPDALQPWAFVAVTESARVSACGIKVTLGDVDEPRNWPEFIDHW